LPSTTTPHDPSYHLLLPLISRTNDPCIPHGIALNDEEESS
jgi:hypothetical protein